MLRCRYLVCILVGAGFCAGVSADTIEFKPEPGAVPISGNPDEGLTLEGKVKRETGEFIFFLVNEDKGEIRIPKNKIKKIDYDITTKISALKEDDFAGRYKVGVWAMEKAMYVEAIAIFEKLKGQEGAGPDMLKLLAKAYEKRNQKDKAFEEYSEYLKLHPDDAEVAAKVAELKKIVAPDDPKAKTDPATGAGAATGDAPKAKPVVEGLEGDGTWIAENWAIPAKAQFSVDPNNGNRTLVIQTEGFKGDKDKVAVSRTGQPLDLSESKEMLLRVFHNEEKPIQMAIAFVNSQGEWHETAQIRVPPNSWNSPVYKIDGKRFKATRNNFKDFDLELEGKGNIKRIVFLFYTQKPFTLYLDGIFFK